ncbi:MAG: argininosuccinate synthase [Armatimonadetes bacterium]|nr:argininosuccinate synthase [Armatimonadota bacterium]
MTKRVLLAFSGGLDTSYCALYLREQGYEVHTATVNTGGFSQEEQTRIASVAEQAHVISHTLVDGRERLFDRYLRYLVYGNSLRGNLYPLSVSAERVCQAELIVKRAKEIGATYLAHGSTGAGNDQVRFDVAFRALYPEAEILTPIRDLTLSRDYEMQYLEERGIHLPPKVRGYSVNEGMWGASVGGRETLSTSQPLPDEEFPGGHPTETEGSLIQISFEKGNPVSLDGEPMPAVDLVERLNELGRKYGIGRGHHMGDTILGIKGRIGFEAPAATILIQAHRELEKLVQTGKQAFWKETIGNLYGSMLHEGHFFDPLCRDLEAYLTSSQVAVTGDVRLQLRPYSCSVVGADSPYSLMNPEVASYGEQNRLWNGAEAAGFAKVYGVPQYLVAKVQGGLRSE